MAQLPKVETLLQRVINIKPGYEQGRAQLYLGVIPIAGPTGRWVAILRLAGDTSNRP